MTTPTGIDRFAPVIANHEIDIAASLDEVWQLHVNINAWPTWHHEVSIADLDGAFAPGHSFTWTSYDFTVTSTIYDVELREDGWRRARGYNRIVRRSSSGSGCRHLPRHS